jgi:hypothetical protein
MISNPSSCIRCMKSGFEDLFGMERAIGSFSCPRKAGYHS